MPKLLLMAEGVHVDTMPSSQLAPGAEAKKRPNTSDGKEEPVRKMPVAKFGPRPRFEPVHFVSGGVGGGTGVGGGLIGGGGGVTPSGTDEKENEKEHRRAEVYAMRQRAGDNPPFQGGRAYGSPSAYPNFRRPTPYASDTWTEQRGRDVATAGTVGLGFGSRGCASNFMTKPPQDYSSKFEVHGTRHSGYASQGNRFEEYGVGTRSGGWDSGCQGLGLGYQDRPSSSRAFSRVYGSPSFQPASGSPSPISPALMDEKQRLIAKVSSAMAATLKDPTSLSGPDTTNYNFILSRSIQACKTNPEYIYVNLRDIPHADLPKNRKVPSDGYACELRCQCVYLATGYSGSKNGARDRASEQAVKLFMKPVEVRVVQRRYRHTYVNDMVVCQANSPTPSFLPALRNPEDKPPPSSKGQYEHDKRKHWTEFVIVDNAHDAICILNNSAAFNRMKIDYKFDLLPGSSTWRCSVYLQDELVAQANGNKKTSKHAAAEEALRKLRLNQAAKQQQVPRGGHLDAPGGRCVTRKKHLSELVILENSDNAICIINDTAQFNKVAADYKFTVLPDHRWKCDVYLEGQYVASGVGPKKTVKHIAAEQALATLRQTQAVVKSNLRREANVEAISRNQILARVGEDSMRQEIKEDNIGNQLLRKMGWKGGGLGREGEGIAEPIQVKEQFSREGLGLDTDKPGNQLTKRDIEEIIRDYATSERQDDLRFSTELNNDERKQIHQVSQKYGLRSKSYGQGRQRFLIVSRKVQKEQLIGQLLQEGQVGRYELVKPQASH